jgi:hypothetical protein
MILFRKMKRGQSLCVFVEYRESMVHPAKNRTAGGTNMEHGSTLDERKAAEFLGLAVQSLRNRRCKRLPPPYVKIGSRVLYLIVDLENFLQQHRIDPGAAV